MLLDLLNLGALGAEVDLTLQVSDGLVDGVDLLLELGPLVGGEVDLLAGLDFEGQIQIGFDVVESVPLVGHALGKSGEPLCGVEGTRVEGAIHIVDLLPDDLNVGHELLLARLKIGQIISCIIFVVSLLMSEV